MFHNGSQLEPFPRGNKKSTEMYNPYTSVYTVKYDRLCTPHPILSISFQGIPCHGMVFMEKSNHFIHSHVNHIDWIDNLFFKKKTNQEELVQITLCHLHSNTKISVTFSVNALVIYLL